MGNIKMIMRPEAIHGATDSEDYQISLENENEIIEDIEHEVNEHQY